MTRDEAREYARGQMEDYLRDKGININRPFRCLSPDHNDENPSMSYDRKRWKVHCFSCGADWDIFDLVGAEYNIRDGKDKFSKAYELLGVRIDGDSTLPGSCPASPKPKAKRQKKPNASLASFLKACQTNLEKTEYLKTRGISFDTAQRFGLGFSMNRKVDFGVPWPAIIIPTSESSFVARNVNPGAEKNGRVRKYGSSEALNYEAVKGNDPVFLVEGEFDLLSVEEVGYRAVSLGSAANVLQFLSLCKNDQPRCPGFILFLDNDEEGRKSTAKLAEGLDKLGILSIGPSDGAILGEHKDANEFLISNWDDFRCALGEYTTLALSVFECKRKELLGDNAAAYIETFQGVIAESASTETIPSGFVQLDFQLDDGFYPGFYVLGAITSLGKTTFALQIGDQIARNGTDVLIFSLEMSRFELMAKSISRLTMEHCDGETMNAKTTRGILAGKRYRGYSNAEINLIGRAVEEYQQIAANVYISEGQGEIGVLQVRERINKHLSLMGGRRPFVIVDYLQLLAPYDPRSTDKQNTDKAVLELKRISRDFKIPVLAISSFNRQNYAQAVSMEAFKESGAIEYSSDVLMGLQAKGAGVNGFNIDKEKGKEPREVELKILKNRNGRTGGVIEYKYYPKFNLFEEVRFYTS